MILKQCFLTNNITYKKQIPIAPKGIIVHSTGVNQTWLGRWVQPSLDDPHRKEIIEDIGYNAGMGWNSSSIDTIVHAMIGLNEHDTVEIYQTLQFDKRCGGCYKGVNGSYNDTHIQFEMQEDNHKNVDYFNTVIENALEFCVYLCKEYNIPASEICSHKEAAARGYASYHGDPENWFEDMPGNWNMDKFRAEVERRLGSVEPVKAFNRGDVVAVKSGVTTNYAGKELAKWVYDGRPLYVYSSDEKLTKITVDKTLSAVTATMNTKDLYLVSDVQPEPEPKKKHTIKCNYYSMKNEIRTFIGSEEYTFEDGDEYTITTPDIEYMTPDTPEVSGVVSGNAEYNIFYYPVTFTIGLHCVDEDGNTIFSDDSESYDFEVVVDGGDSYSISAPEIPLYIPETDLFEGIATRNESFVVRYKDDMDTKKKNLFAAFIAFIKAFFAFFKIKKEDVGLTPAETVAVDDEPMDAESRIAAEFAAEAQKD